MARKRMVSPEFFTSEQILRVSPLARLLFIGLWTQADRRGILEDRPVHLKINVLPMDQCDVVTLLDELAGSAGQDGAPLVYRYRDQATARPLIWIPCFCRHQHPHRDEKPGPYDLPMPSEPWASTLLPQCQHGASTMAARCQPGAKVVPTPVQHHGSRPDSGFRMPESETKSKTTGESGIKKKNASASELAADAPAPSEASRERETETEKKPPPAAPAHRKPQRFIGIRKLPEGSIEELATEAEFNRLRMLEAAVLAYSTRDPVKLVVAKEKLARHRAAILERLDAEGLSLHPDDEPKEREAALALVSASVENVNDHEEVTDGDHP